MRVRNTNWARSEVDRGRDAAAEGARIHYRLTAVALASVKNIHTRFGKRSRASAFAFGNTRQCLKPGIAE